MKTYDLVLTAGTETRLNIDYNFFLVLADGGFPFDVSLFKGSGFQPCEGVSAGFGVRLNEYRGKEFIFKSSNTQTIKVFVGNDEAIYQRLSGTVTINGGTLATVSTISALTGITNTVKAVSDGQSYGASFRSAAFLATNGVETVFTAAANVNGAIVHSAQFIEMAATGPYVNGAFLAKATAPASITDGDAILGADNILQGSSLVSAGGSLKNPMRIPAGKGLFFISGGPQSTVASRSALYTLLP